MRRKAARTATSEIKDALGTHTEKFQCLNEKMLAVETTVKRLHDKVAVGKDGYGNFSDALVQHIKAIVRTEVEAIFASVAPKYGPPGLSAPGASVLLEPDAEFSPALKDQTFLKTPANLSTGNLDAMRCDAGNFAVSLSRGHGGGDFPVVRELFPAAQVEHNGDSAARNPAARSSSGDGLGLSFDAQPPGASVPARVEAVPRRVKLEKARQQQKQLQDLLARTQSLAAKKQHQATSQELTRAPLQETAGSTSHLGAVQGGSSFRSAVSGSSEGSDACAGAESDVAHTSDVDDDADGNDTHGDPNLLMRQFVFTRLGAAREDSIGAAWLSIAKEVYGEDQLGVIFSASDKALNKDGIKNWRERWKVYDTELVSLIKEIKTAPPTAASFSSFIYSAPGCIATMLRIQEAIPQDDTSREKLARRAIRCAMALRSAFLQLRPDGE